MGVSPLGPRFAPGQRFGDNPTANLPPTHDLIRRFGNYQPLGHTGTDYPAATGTPVYATEDGVIMWAADGALLPGDDSGDGWASRYYLRKDFLGLGVVIEHGARGGYVTVNAHLSKFAAGLKPFDRVKRGQLIGYVGSTGASTGPHLHFEVIPTSYPWGNGHYGRVNPGPYIADPWPTDSKPEPVKTPTTSSRLQYIDDRASVRAFTRGADCPAVFGFVRPALPVSDVVHWWDDPAKGPTFDGTRSWFKGQPVSGVSAHYVGEAGRVAHMVDESNASHANGHGAANAQTVTHEWNPRCSPEDLEALAEHLATIWVRRGRTTPGIVEMHRDYLATECPGRYVAHLPAVRKRAAELFAAKRSGATVKPPPDQPVVGSSSGPGLAPLPVGGFHVAVKGDSVAGIAKRYGRTIGQLVAWNRYITNPSYLAVGDRVRVEPPAKPASDAVYVVKPGDSLGSIAARYGTTVPALVNRNRYITNPGYLAVGDRVSIPQSNDVVIIAKAGDTPGKLAARYGTDLGTVLALNPYIKNPNYLAVGDRVRLSR